MITVQLTMAELNQAAAAGVWRRLTSIREGYDKNKHAEKSDWQTDIDGAAAEMAFAKYKGMYWSASNRSFKEPDVGEWHIRSTCHADGHLIIRPNDKMLDARFVFAITRVPFVDIIGWCTAGEARQDEFRRVDSWWVPRSASIFTEFEQS